MQYSLTDSGTRFLSTANKYDSIPGGFCLNNFYCGLKTRVILALATELLKL